MYKKLEDLDTDRPLNGIKSHDQSIVAPIA